MDLKPLCHLSHSSPDLSPGPHFPALTVMPLASLDALGSGVKVQEGPPPQPSQREWWAGPLAVDPLLALHPLAPSRPCPVQGWAGNPPWATPGSAWGRCALCALARGLAPGAPFVSGRRAGSVPSWGPALDFGAWSLCRPGGGCRQTRAGGLCWVRRPCLGELSAQRGRHGSERGGEGAGPGAEPDLLGKSSQTHPRPRQRVYTPAVCASFAA